MIYIEALKWKTISSQYLHSDASARFHIDLICAHVSVCNNDQSVEPQMLRNSDVIVYDAKMGFVFDSPFFLFVICDPYKVGRLNKLQTGQKKETQ